MGDERRSDAQHDTYEWEESLHANIFLDALSCVKLEIPTPLGTQSEPWAPVTGSLPGWAGILAQVLRNPCKVRQEFLPKFGRNTYPSLIEWGCVMMTRTGNRPRRLTRSRAHGELGYRPCELASTQPPIAPASSEAYIRLAAFVGLRLPGPGGPARTTAWMRASAPEAAPTSPSDAAIDRKRRGSGISAELRR